MVDYPFLRSQEPLFYEEAPQKKIIDRRSLDECNQRITNSFRRASRIMKYAAPLTILSGSLLVAEAFSDKQLPQIARWTLLYVAGKSALASLAALGLGLHGYILRNQRDAYLERCEPHEEPSFRRTLAEKNESNAFRLSQDVAQPPLYTWIP